MPENNLPDNPTQSKAELSLLYNISATLNENQDLKKALYEVLDILNKSMEMVHGTVSILNPLRDEINIEVAHGVAPNKVEHIRYKPGEGILGKVIQTGKAVSLPRISDEPQFLNRTEQRTMLQGRELSFICVPIKKGTKVVGALSVDIPFDENRDLAHLTQLLIIVASMIASYVIKLEDAQVEREHLREENRQLQNKLKSRYSFKNIIGNSNKMREVFQMVTQVSESNATVLIRGESGTGKELIANAIHYNSLRSQKPFIKVNCAALPSNLIESELFGHERGAFTGAINQKLGKFELANRGTIFLDEIGSISMDVQTKLLRVLQEREFERVGGSRTLKIDVRVIAATNKNLEDAIEQGIFRGDLYYRLNVFPIYLAPLRERKTDVLLLAEHFLARYARENHKNIKRFSTSAIDLLMAYHWPGNVRELENCIERAVLLCETGVIHSYHLPPTLQIGSAKENANQLSLAEAMESLEKDMLIDALKSTNGNISAAAKLLQTTVRKFAYKADRYGISYKNFR